jgi:predicted nucleic-acid-binding protein
VTDTSIVDANVILRYLLGDHPELSSRAKAFFDGVRAGERGAYVAESVIVECVYVMQRVYNIPRNEITESLTILLGFRGIVGEQTALLRHALALYAETNVSFVDALIAATAINKELPVETYDKDLEKLLAQ